MFSTLRYELIYYIKNKKELIVISILFISFFLLFPFTLKNNFKIAPQVAQSLLWLACLTVYNLSAATLYERDRLAGRLEYYQLQPVRLEWIILAKWLGNYTAMLLPMFLMLPIIGLLTGIETETGIRLAAALIFGGASLSAITNLGAALMAGLGQGAGAILGLLVLPLSIPVIIFGADYTAGGNVDGLWFLAGISLFLLPLMCLAGSASIRNSN